jgi:O-antigen ligase
VPANDAAEPFAARLSEQFASAALIAVLAWAPFPIGSNRPWWWSLLAVLVALVWVAWLPAGLLSAGETVRSARRIALPGAAFVVVIAWAFLQCASWTPVSWHNAIWSVLPEGTGRAVTGAISMNPFVTASEAMKLATYVCAGWLAFALSRNHGIARRLLVSLVVVAALYAVYGMVLSAMSSGQSMVFEGTPPPYGQDVTGTFVSKNSFATYDGMALAACLLLVAESGRGSIVVTRGARQIMVSLLQFLLGRGAFYVVGAAVLFLALVLSDSRAGLLSTLGGLFVLFAFGVVSAARRGAARWALAASGATLAAMLVLFTLSGESLENRFDQLVETQGNIDLRPVMWDAAMRAIGDHPLLGNGLGTFADSYALYADRFEPYVVDRVHEDYLELALGLGIPMAALWIAAMGALVWQCARGALRRRRRRLYSLAAVAAAVIVGLHSLVDFSLQMPAVSLVFAVLMGIGLAQSEGTAASATLRTRGSAALC